MKLKNNQSGIAHVAIVLVVVVLVIIGLVGYRLMQQDDKSNSKTDAKTAQSGTDDSSDNSKSDADDTDSGTKYLTIKEWGVRFPLTTATADAYYDTKTASSLESMSLRSHALDTEADCTNTAQSVASIFRVPKDTVNDQTGKKYSEAGDGQTIGDYYYFVQSSQYMCTEDTEKAILLQGIRNSFNAAGPTIIKS